MTYCRPCERCNALAKSGYKFCPECRKKQLREMQEAGYLAPKVYSHSNRTRDMKENRHETQYGIDD
jgi:hypothetical protein